MVNAVRQPTHVLLCLTDCPCTRALLLSLVRFIQSTVHS